jgi:hypothetical protein
MSKMARLPWESERDWGIRLGKISAVARKNWVESRGQQPSKELLDKVQANYERLDRFRPKAIAESVKANKAKAARRNKLKEKYGAVLRKIRETDSG